MARRLLLAFASLFMASALVACDPAGVTSIPTGPAEIADKTTVDERVILTIEAAATAAPRAATLAIKAGIITDVATIRQIGAWNDKLDRVMTKLEAVYRAGNAATFWQLHAEALGLIRSLNSKL